ncbi:MAG: hypothetical protein M1818_005115 [Claussenomyces sp. TS43310]|nr:MAG: hypothetical protein M1818_005115 [Claussenomyces sp. TS43310]
MRMFRFSSWISESRGSEEVNGEPGIVADAIRPLPSLALKASSMAKRKREDDVTPPAMHEDTSSPVAKRLKTDVQMQQDVGPNSEAVDVGRGVKSSNQMREAIDSQLGLEILLKHGELRLVNQEMAKCQVALEQLRRCHLIPFPGTQSLSDSVSIGTGPAVIQGDKRPQWAAPFGLTDGPYTRHYARWLIPDPSFDGGQPEWSQDRSRAAVSEGRTTRHSYADFSTPSNKPRSQRGSAGQKLQALPSGYTQSKENAGPSVLKRGDGQMVKLVCLDCRRENFGSTQGFINHCRIAHRREFKSHEEAAAQSGVPIELDEVGGIVGEEKPVPAASGLVHPLIRSAPTDKEAYTALLSRISASLNLFHEGKLAGVMSIPRGKNFTPIRPRPARPSQTFVPSVVTPHLSNLMRDRGFDGNLDSLVDEAKTAIDLDDLSSHDEESDVEKDDQVSRRLKGFDGPSDIPVPSMRLHARATMSPAPYSRPASSKGLEVKNSRIPSFAPRLPIDTVAAGNHSRPTTRIVRNVDDNSFEDEDVSTPNGPSIVDLSPNTVASNNAPSLVSDDGEYDDGDDAESSIDGSEGEDEGSDVAEIKIEDVEAIERGRKGSGSDPVSFRKEDKHVTFVSPMKEAKAGRKKK